MAEHGAFGWNSELPSGRSPFWIQDEGLSALGLHGGDAVSVDTRAEPAPGDLVVFEAELEDGDSVRLARRYFPGQQGSMRLEPMGPGEVLELPEESVMVLGVIRARLRVEDQGASVLELPLDSREPPRHVHG